MFLFFISANNKRKTLKKKRNIYLLNHIYFKMSNNKTIDIPLGTVNKNQDDSDSELEEQQPSTTEEHIDPVSYLENFKSI